VAVQAGVSRPGWPARIGRAARFALFDHRATPVALLGFIVRGGIAFVLIPSAVLPSVLEMVRLSGPKAVTIAGDPTLWLLGVTAAAAVVVVLWLALAAFVGSLTDAWLLAMERLPERPRRVRHRVEAGRPESPAPAEPAPAEPAERLRLPMPGLPLLARMAAIRLLPLLVVAGVGLLLLPGTVYQAAYDEWISPSDLTSPLILRVLLDTAPVIAAVLLVWLAAETLAAVAVRRQMFLGRGVAASLREGAVQLVRRPLTTLLTVSATYAVSLVVTVAAIVGTAAAFDWCRSAARAAEPIAVTIGVGDFAITRDFRPVAFAAAAVALTLAWAVSLAVLGIASVWRNAAMTEEVADAVAGEMACLDAPAVAPGVEGTAGMPGHPAAAGRGR
jgi:hypothetical protein